MITPDIIVNATRIKLSVDYCIPEKDITGLINKKNLGHLLLSVKNKHAIDPDFIIQKVVLNLGAIPLQHASIHLHQRLLTALNKLFMQLAKIPQNASLLTDEAQHSAVQEGHRSLLAQAIAFLQADTLPSLANSTAQNVALYQSLLQALQKNGAANAGFHAQTAYKENIRAAVPQRRLAHLALSYLLTERDGCRWLCQRSLTLAQRDDWAAAIIAREIQPQQVLQLIELLDAIPTIEAQAIAGRWIVPVWRYPGVSRAVQQQLGKTTVQQIEDSLASLLPTSRFVTPAANVAGASWQATAPAEVASASRQAATLVKIASRTRHRRTFGEPVVEGLAVSNAGVILFWPLFVQWFTALGLIEDKKFISEDARWQAVVAIDWLVWEQEHLDAQRLVINQFLCGLPLSDPPAPLTPLSPELRQTTQTWASAITQQLTSFEKLSLTDIRQLFLQRSGELFADTTPAVLNIKPEPFDILLTKWPWPLNLAYFPWFDTPLIIEWPGSQPAGTRL